MILKILSLYLFNKKIANCDVKKVHQNMEISDHKVQQCIGLTTSFFASLSRCIAVYFIFSFGGRVFLYCVRQ